MPVSIARLRELIDLAGAGGVEGIDLVEDGTHIRITRSAAFVAPVAPASTLAPPPAAAPVAAAAQDLFIAPMVGVLHMTPAPGARPFVAAGERVVPGQQLCLIEAMKMFNAVHCDRAGILDAILVEPGTDVTRGQPLFRIRQG